MQYRKKHIVWLILAGGAAGMAFFLGRFPATNVAETRADHDDPLLRTRHYGASMEQLHNAVRGLLPALHSYGRRWELVSSVKSHGTGGSTADTFHAVVPVLVFSDDLVVTLRGEANGTAVDVRSASRVGKGDLGENRRHIIQFLTALEVAVAAARPQ